MWPSDDGGEKNCPSLSWKLPIPDLNVPTHTSLLEDSDRRRLKTVIGHSSFEAYSFKASALWAFGFKAYPFWA